MPDPTALADDAAMLEHLVRWLQRSALAQADRLERVLAESDRRGTALSEAQAEIQEAHRAREQMRADRHMARKAASASTDRLVKIVAERDEARAQVASLEADLVAARSETDRVRAQRQAALDLCAEAEHGQLCTADIRRALGEAE